MSAQDFHLFKLLLVVVYFFLLRGRLCYHLTRLSSNEVNPQDSFRRPFICSSLLRWDQKACGVRAAAASLTASVFNASPSVQGHITSGQDSVQRLTVSTGAYHFKSRLRSAARHQCRGTSLQVRIVLNGSPSVQGHITLSQGCVQRLAINAGAYHFRSG
jgi:hypothetical protein